MTAILAIAAVLGIAYVLRRGKPVAALPDEPVSLAKSLWEEQEFPGAPKTEVKLPIYSPGVVFHHKGTGEKVEVLQAPEIVNGEYKIQWPSGEVGYIHESSFEEFFV